MTLAIHAPGPGFARPGNFADRWIAFCVNQEIPFRQVDCYRSDIFDQLRDCRGLLWHFSPDVPDRLFAKQLLTSLSSAGLAVFPNPSTMWFSYDKIAQSYLLKSIGAPIPDFKIFYNKREALNWARRDAIYPKVFKLREGAGGENVLLVPTEREARNLISRAFGRGTETYRRIPRLRERVGRRQSKKDLVEAWVKGSYRIVVPPRYSTVAGRHRDYAYFQDFVPHNDHDIRVIVIGSRAFALKRGVRPGDFRASGSGIWSHNPDEFNPTTIKTAFEVARQLRTQCAAFDFVHQDAQPLILEMDFGFTPAGYDDCPGYWTDDLRWNDGPFDPYGWMVTDLLEQ